MAFRILLVDDSVDDIELCEIVTGSLRDDVDLDIARDGLEAMERLQTGEPAGAQRRPAPNLILLDLKMPKVNGLDLLKQIRTQEDTKFTPVVVLTSSAEPLDVNRAFAAGCNSYLIKPVSFQRFEEMMAMVLRYWIDCNTSPN